jgi:hypothetical protein
MPVLAQSKTVRSDAPTLLVENPFAPGRYRFELTVVDDAGNESAPAQIVVEVRGRRVVDPGDVLDGLRDVFDPRRGTPTGPGRIRPLRPEG